MEGEYRIVDLPQYLLRDVRFSPGEHLGLASGQHDEVELLLGFIDLF